MNAKQGLLAWVMMALLTIPMVLLVFFYLLLYKGFSVPGSALIIPAIILCGSVLPLSAALYLARKRNDPRLFFVATGAYCAVFLVEGIHFTVYLGYLSNARAMYAYPACLLVLTTDMVISYYAYRYLSRKKE